MRRAGKLTNHNEPPSVSEPISARSRYDSLWDSGGNLTPGSKGSCLVAEKRADVRHEAGAEGGDMSNTSE
ncbi:UNVERIFIED_CONTAM: hypothetical protein K2H54_007689 [Gekko kuhli]